MSRQSHTILKFHKKEIYSYLCLQALLVAVQCGDIMRKSIVFDKNTPDVFYCPQHKPIGFEKMLVKARPLSRLCQFEGRPIPEDYKSDCYNDVDETEYACKEKYRIMVSVKFIYSPAKSLNAINAPFIRFIKKTNNANIFIIKYFNQFIQDMLKKGIAFP